MLQLPSEETEAQRGLANTKWPGGLSDFCAKFLTTQALMGSAEALRF